ncbi:MAG: Actin-like protein arp9 (SWI/SNF complex component arp9) [Trizodia sp. TS-e1964]|nr:MAG: Actin-like protein arp9 (SWI/SNF complex component arp9) [Trizodia sp. TS-e1964]
MPMFKDDNIMIIAPGSQTTLAQLGLPESFTPAKLRVSSRMFPADKKGEYEPLKIRKKQSKRVVSHGEAPNGPTKGGGPSEDTEMPDVDPASRGLEVDEDDVYEEDLDSLEGAIYPLKEGRVVHWEAFYALLTFVYNTLSPGFHTPILIVSQPAWTFQDHEMITQFFFEKFRIPAFAIMDSALAICYAFGVPTATVIDVGYEKTDVTAVQEFMVHDVGRGTAIKKCGGHDMTRRLYELLEPKGLTEAMCEQLKRSPICEILAIGTELPGETEAETLTITNPAAAASTGALGSGPGQRVSAAALGEAPMGPGPDTEVGDEDGYGNESKEAEDGVLDIANIVASGKTSEFLARKEREKQEKSAAKKAAADAATALAKPVRLPNSRRLRNVFFYEERRLPGNVAEEARNTNDRRAAEPQSAIEADVSKALKSPVPIAETSLANLPPPEPSINTAASANPPSLGAVSIEVSQSAVEQLKINTQAANMPSKEELAAPVGQTPTTETVSPTPVSGFPAPPASRQPATLPPISTTGNTFSPTFGQTSTTMSVPPTPTLGQPLSSTQTVPPTPTTGAPLSAYPIEESELKRREQARAARKEERRRIRIQGSNLSIVRREIEVGRERFLAGSDGVLLTIADAVHRTVSAIPDVSKRAELWDALIIVGNGSKVRGFKDALIGLLNNKYVISPSSATIFTSELPSNLSTPLATGANTPQPQALGAPPHSSSTVNPLLLAATTANASLHPMAASGLSPHGGAAAHPGHAHSSHGQTPTSIKTVKAPEYFPEWKDVGFDEAVFLGAQVGAKVVFVIDQGASKAFMTRVEYNESGPQGIHEYTM